MAAPKTVTASEFTRNFGRYRMHAQRAAVAVSSHGQITGYFVGPDEYEELRRFRESRRNFATAELAEETGKATGASRMETRRKHLDPGADSRINHRRLGQLSEEFTELWTRLQAFYLDAVAGFAFVHRSVDAEPAEARSDGQESEPDSEDFHRATQGDVKVRNAPNGANVSTLGQLCLVSFYDFWADYLRREYVIATGHLDPHERDREIVEKAYRQYASRDLWSDIRQLRISILHNRGRATSDIAKCKLIKWFNPNDPIFLPPDRMRHIFLALLDYRNELFREQFPQQLIRPPPM